MCMKGTAGRFRIWSAFIVFKRGHICLVKAKGGILHRFWSGKIKQCCLLTACIWGTKSALYNIFHTFLLKKEPISCEIQSGCTYGQGHHVQLPPDEFDHHALLQRSGAAAEHSAAMLRQLQEFLLQPSLEDDVQCPSINHQPKLGGLRDWERCWDDAKKFPLWFVVLIILLHLFQG